MNTLFEEFAIRALTEQDVEMRFRAARGSVAAGLALPDRLDAAEG